jgi:hypothetical protein
MIKFGGGGGDSTVDRMDRGGDLGNQHYEVRRPEILSGFNIKEYTAAGTLYVTVNELDGEPYEALLAIGKSGSEVQAMAEALGRSCSMALQRTGDKRETLEALAHQYENIHIIPDAVSRALRRYLYGSLGDYRGGGATSGGGVEPSPGEAAQIREWERGG